MAAVFIGRPTCMVKWDDFLALNPPVVLVLHLNVHGVPLLKPARRPVTDCETTCNSRNPGDREEDADPHGDQFTIMRGIDRYVLPMKWAGQSPLNALVIQ